MNPIKRLEHATVDLEDQLNIFSEQLDRVLEEYPHIVISKRPPGDLPIGERIKAAKSIIKLYYDIKDNKDD